MEHFNSTAFDKRVEELIQEWHVPGVSIAVLQDQMISSKGYGQATVDPTRPCNADTLFDMASSSKSLTAASVALLVADDEQHPDVKWETKILELLPDDFVMNEDSYTQQITVEDMLAHRTGLPRHDNSYFGIRSQVHDTAKSVTRNLRNLPVTEPLRTKYMYCNIMYTVATHLVESLSGLSFAEFLATKFFKTLGMNSAQLQPSAPKAAGLGEHLAIGYDWKEESKNYEAVEYQECPEAQGAGSVMASANDYIKWVKALMYQEGPITKEIYQGLTKVRIIADPDMDDEDREPFTSYTGYGAGLEVRYYRGHQIVGHDGSISGFGSRHFFLPAFNFGAVILGNSGFASVLADVVAAELIDEILDVPKDERVDWSARSQKLVEKYEKESKQPLLPKLCPELDSPEAQKIPLSYYCGEYWNAGYRGLKVGIKDNKLFVDASDRSMGFYLVFEHLRGQTSYSAKLIDYFDGVDALVAAEFRFENEKVVKLGVDLEDAMGGLVWFNRTIDGDKQAMVAR